MHTHKLTADTVILFSTQPPEDGEGKFFPQLPNFRRVRVAEEYLTTRRYNGNHTCTRIKTWEYRAQYSRGCKSPWVPIPPGLGAALSPALQASPEFPMPSLRHQNSSAFWQYLNLGMKLKAALWNKFTFETSSREPGLLETFTNMSMSHRIHRGLNLNIEVIHWRRLHFTAWSI